MAGVEREPAFFDRFVSGDVAVKEIDEAVSAWHCGAGGGRSLHAWLGLTWPEYQEWVMDAGALPRIRKRRMQPVAGPAQGGAES